MEEEGEEKVVGEEGRHLVRVQGMVRGMGLGVAPGLEVLMVENIIGMVVEGEAVGEVVVEEEDLLMVLAQDMGLGLGLVQGTVWAEVVEVEGVKEEVVEVAGAQEMGREAVRDMEAAVDLDTEVEVERMVVEEEEEVGVEEAAAVAGMVLAVGPVMGPDLVVDLVVEVVDGTNHELIET